MAEAILRQLEKLETPVSPFAPDYAPTKGRWSKRAKGSGRWVKATAVEESQPRGVDSWRQRSQAARI